jgi:hypothetical protein
MKIKQHPPDMLNGERLIQVPEGISTNGRGIRLMGVRKRNLVYYLSHPIESIFEIHDYLDLAQILRDRERTQDEISQDLLKLLSD